MISPEDEVAARASAELHAVLRILAAQPTRTQPGQCLLAVELLGIRRAPAGLASGDRIELWVDSRWRGQRSPPGEDVRLDIEALQPGVLLEAWARRDGPANRFAVVLGQVQLV